jgi:hypothetical protein
VFVQIVLYFPSGIRLTGVLLSVEQERMRIVLPDQTETMELRRVNRQWISDSGERVEIEAIIAGKAPRPKAQASHGCG